MSLEVFTLGAIALTIGAYRFSLFVRRRWAHPLTTPVLFSTSVVVAMLLLVRADAAAYEPAKGLLSFLLGPATVALAIPLYRNRAAFQRRLVPALAGLLAGITVTVSLAIACGRAFGLDTLLQSTLAVKSTTTAIAIEVARIVHGDPALAAGFVVCTGTFGAAFGPWLLDRARVDDPVARGVAYGSIAHGIGTAQAATESELAGAVAGVSLGIGGIVTAALAPLLLRLLGN
ncbi:MAG TPA: LrgB family protein [Candidatus Elarobacter sp.]|jgi:putative effector of murein hydrolase|nr:LrgB family protein [Candidatus Elarobacter sp.]